MAKQGTKTVTPRLRFPEFWNALPWTWGALSDVCEMQAGKFTSASEIAEKPSESAYPCYGGNGLRGYTATYTHSGKYPLIGRQGALCGNVQLVEGEFYATEHALVSRPRSHIDVTWLYYSLGRLRLNHFATGQAQPGLSVDVLNGVECPVPAIEDEQQKIADCLMSLDEVIAAQGRKVEALKAHKRGLMQQLFPREGKTRPRLRFPEFHDAPEWEVQRLDGFIDEFRQQSNTQDEFEVLTSARSGLMRQRDYYDNDRITGRDNVGFNVIPPNYLTYRSRSDDRTFYFNENNLGITGIISIYYPVFRICGGSSRFFINLLARYADVIGKHSVGTSQTVLSLNELRKVKLPVPLPDEQQRIADCLTSLDTRIHAETARLAALKTHKQGLMQQLFPAPEAAGA